MRRFTYILACVLLLSSCEYNFELDEGNEENCLYIQCTSGLADTTFIAVQTAIPVNRSNATPNVKTEITKLSLSAGGRNCLILKAGNRFDEWGEKDEHNIYYTVDKILPGDELVLEAEAVGCGRAVAKTTVPAVPNVGDLSVVKMGNNLHFDLDLKCGADEDRYFGVQLWAMVNESIVDGDSSETVGESEFVCYIFDNAGEFLDLGTEFDTVGFNGVEIQSYGQNEITIVHSKDLKNGHLNVFSMGEPDVDLPLDKVYYDDGKSDESETGGLWDSISGRYVCTTKYKFVVYELSPELYRYSKARSSEWNDVLGELGFSAPTFGYSNVAGGFGLLGAASRAESGTVSNPPGYNPYNEY